MTRSEKEMREGEKADRSAWPFRRRFVIIIAARGAKKGEKGSERGIEREREPHLCERASERGLDVACPPPLRSFCTQPRCGKHE